MMRTSILLSLAALAVAGCANQPGTTYVDRNFGNAVNAAKAAQVADPDAPLRARAPMATEGERARTAVQQYEKSVTNPAAPASVLNIGIGASATTTTTGQ
jgi:type IV pilus biogenesis protein CpaD/CtpE